MRTGRVKYRDRSRERREMLADIWESISKGWWEKRKNKKRQRAHTVKQSVVIIAMSMSHLYPPFSLRLIWLLCMQDMSHFPSSALCVSVCVLCTWGCMGIPRWFSHQVLSPDHQSTDLSCVLIGSRDVLSQPMKLQQDFMARVMCAVNLGVCERKSERNRASMIDEHSSIRLCM